MNLDALYQTIKSPELISADEVIKFKDLSEKYPFSQIFPIIYLNALAKYKDIRFEDELKKYAYKISDRAKLFDLIHQQKNELTDSKVELEVFVENETAQQELIQTENTNGKQVEIVENEPFLNSYVENNLTDEAVQSADKESINEKGADAELIDQETVNLLEPEKDVSSEKVENIKNDFLEKEILSNIVASAYSLELEEKQNETEGESIAKHKTHKKIDLKEERSFSSWLKIGIENGWDLVEDVDSKQKIEEKEKIIDAFISKENRISKPKAEFFSAPKKAKESVDEGKLMYSETLANIFELQGNYPKAIKAFEQLCLTIPEKKLYFAKKIEELNKKINP